VRSINRTVYQTRHLRAFATRVAALEKRGVEPVKVERAAGPLFEGKA
jgi:hypothetical protein